MADLWTNSEVLHTPNVAAEGEAGHCHTMAVRGRYGPNHGISLGFPQHVCIALKVGLEENRARRPARGKQSFSIECPVKGLQTPPPLNDNLLILMSPKSQYS